MENSTLVGTYRLVSWENRHESGAITYPLGADAEGIISYSPDGFVFVHIMATGRARHAVDDLFGGEDSELRESATTHMSYCGTFEVEGSEVVHHVSISSFPNWTRSDVRRHCELRNGQLVLSAQGLYIGGERVDIHLIWELVKDETS